MMENREHGQSVRGRRVLRQVTSGYAEVTRYRLSHNVCTVMATNRDGADDIDTGKQGCCFLLCFYDRALYICVGLCVISITRLLNTITTIFTVLWKVSCVYARKMEIKREVCLHKMSTTQTGLVFSPEELRHR